MRGLTLQQPYAHEVVFGSKSIENRSWEPPKWLVGNYIAIHAGYRFSPDHRSRMKPDKVTYGAILGIARVAGTVTESRSKWLDDDEYHWKLTDIKPLRKPIARKGLLRLWRLTPAEVRRIQSEFPWIEEDGSRRGSRTANRPASQALTPGQKAARTRKRRAAGRKAAVTRKRGAAARKAAITRKARAAASRPNR